MNQNNPYGSPNQQNGPMNHGQQPGPGGPSYGPGGHRPESEKGTLIIILAALSFVLCGPVFSVPALIMALGERKRINRGEIAPSSAIEAGFWLSVINIILFVVSMGLGFIFFIASAASA